MHLLAGKPGWGDVLRQEKWMKEIFLPEAERKKDDDDTSY